MTPSRRFVRGGATSDVEAAGTLEADPALHAVFEEFGEPQPPVALVVATREEREQMQPCEQELTSRGIAFQTHEMSAHANAALLARWAETAALRGVRVIVATAGMSATLPAILASYTDLPVIGVPLANGPLGGLDTLLATAQQPTGAPVACMAINGTRNAAVFASHILTALPLPPGDAEGV